MKKKFCRQTITALVSGVLLLFYAFGQADAFQYAWGENVGWFNLEPLGRDGPGVKVDGTGLTGHIWGENIGWINLSCENVIDVNDITCAEIDYGVTVGAQERLGGYAWGENVGWVNFAPAGGGVNVDSSGNLSGLAWGENIGWILFNNGWVPMESGTAESLWSVWGSSESDVFAAGDGGTILHYDGSTWSPMDSPTTNNLRGGIWGTSGSDVFIVGVSVILHYDGISWSIMEIPKNRNFRDIWAASENDVFAVGYTSTIMHYDGDGNNDGVPDDIWEEMDSGINNDFFGVWGSSGDNVFVVGDGGTILNYDGTGWTPMISSTLEGLRSIWGTSGTNIYASGLQSTVVHYDGSTWSAPIDIGGGTWAFYSIWGSSESNIFVPRGGNVIHHYDGTEWSIQESGFQEQFFDIWGPSEGEAFAVGQFGTILHYISYTVDDTDGDGIPDFDDNCPGYPNGPNGGTCVEGRISCMDNSECETGFCSMAQEDSDADGFGDACECYLTINPQSQTVNHDETFQFSASQAGDGCNTPNYVWEISEQGSSGALISDAGLYTAGSNAGIDVITVTDANNDNISVSATVTVLYNEAMLSLRNLMAPSGGCVRMPLTLTNALGGEIAGVSADLNYDESLLDLFDCIDGPVIIGTDKEAYCYSLETIYRIGVVSLMDVDPVPDGIVVYTAFQTLNYLYQADTAIGIVCDASDPFGEDVYTDCVPGSIQITKCGDVNNDFGVNISEIVKVVRMHLGYDLVNSVADCDADGVIAINEVIKTINCFQELASCLCNSCTVP